MFISKEEGCKPMPPEVKISWSALKRWKRCSFAQKLAMEGKRVKAKDGRVFFKGNLCDHAMRRWLEAEDFSVPIEHYLKEVWIENTGPDAEYVVKWKSPDDQKIIVDEARAALADLERTLREYVVPFRYEPEMRFTSYVGIPAPNGEIIQVAIFGAIDVAILYPDDTMGIFDLKLSASKSYITSSIGQLVLYDLAIRNYLGIKPTKHGFFTPLLTAQPVIPLEITDDHRQQMVSDIISYAHGIWNNEWSLTEDENNCWGCDYKHACPRWVKPIPLAKKQDNLERFGRR